MTGKSTEKRGGRGLQKMERVRGNLCTSAGLLRKTVLHKIEKLIAMEHKKNISSNRRIDRHF